MGAITSLVVLKRTQKNLQTAPFNEFRGLFQKVVQVEAAEISAERSNVARARVAFIKNFNTAENLIKHQVSPMNKNIARPEFGAIRK